MRTITAFERLKQYYHSHELLSSKVFRRAINEDRGSLNDSTWKQRVRSAAYFIPYLATCNPAYLLVFMPLEKGIGEAIGMGTGRVAQANTLYTSCTAIQRILEDHSYTLTQEKIALVQEHITNILNEINNNVLENPTIQTSLLSFGIAGASKKLKPLALSALHEVIGLCREASRKTSNGEDPFQLDKICERYAAKHAQPLKNEVADFVNSALQEQDHYSSNNKIL